MHAALRRLSVEWRLKITLLVIATVLLLVPYMLLQRYRLFESRALPLTPIDDWAGFASLWVWIYVLQYIQVPLSPLMATSREQLRRYLIGFTLICLPAFVVFLLFPVEGPRPTIEQSENAHWLYQLLIAIDRPGNAMPSLHVALSTYAMCFAHRLTFQEEHRAARRYWLGTGWLSVALISWSTLATKQHYAVDGLAGFLLAVAAHQLVWRTRLFDRAKKNPAISGA